MNYEWNVGSEVISDYLSACQEFIFDDQKFDNFKQDFRYKIILEHVSMEDAEIFISEMKNIKSLTKTQLSKIKENDLYGNPEICAYDSFGNISPSTIRYIKNSLDIYNFLNKKKIENIVEIGGGYGGLCKVINSFYNYDNYVLIDLPIVNELSKKYLNKFSELEGKIGHISYNELDEITDIDLVISNYAFSECSYDSQIKYYNDVILNSKYFYMVYNNITPSNINSDQFLKLASKDFEIDIEEEVRPSYVNYIFYGTKK